MKIKVAKFKDVDELFVEYKDYTISLRLKQKLVSKNILGIKIESEKEKEKFICVFRRFIKELERLEF